MRGLALAALSLLICPGAAWGDAEIQLAVEAGPELDTNAHRIQPLIIRCSPGEVCVDGRCCADVSETDCDPCRVCTVDEQGLVEEAVAAGLMRLTGSARLELKAGRRHLLSLGVSGGGKAFLADQASAADEVVQRAELGWGIRFRPVALSLSGSYHDAFQRLSQRDFRTGSGVARLSFAHEDLPVAASAYAGYHGFQHKPLPGYSFNALVAGLELQSQLTSGPEEEQVDWNLSLSYTVAARYFFGPALGLPQQDPDDQTCGLWRPLEQDAGREDLNHLLRAQAGYLGNAEATFWYSLEINQSNSYGESFTRHAVGIRFTTPLVWRLFVTVKGVLQLSRFVDPFFVSPTASVNVQTPEGLFTIDDENRSRLELILARDLTDRLAVMLRYGLYVNESVTHTALPQVAELKGFKRHTLFSGLRFEYGL